jgi:alpha-beta hydrolase superfamily lysophospholipase
VQYGSGETAVIFSPMGDCVGDWARLAGAAAAKGMLALTIQWRACGPNGADATLLRAFVDDLRAAIGYVREQGAERVVLVGASLGGVASAKLLAEAQAAGLVVMAAPADVPSLGVTVTAADVNSGVPKLFITAEADAVVDAAQSRALFDLAAEPKEWKTYPGTAHGTGLFASEAGGEAEKYILNFIAGFAM